MRIVFTKISDDRHTVTVTRADGSSESAELESRSFLRHDLAHFAIELELPIEHGYWGCVSRGASLRGDGVTGSDASLAERLSGPIQTLFRTDASAAEYTKLLDALLVRNPPRDLGARVHERVRQLRGHWRATPYGGSMELEWPD